MDCTDTRDWIISPPTDDCDDPCPMPIEPVELNATNASTTLDVHVAVRSGSTQRGAPCIGWVSGVRVRQGSSPVVTTLSNFTNACALARLGHVAAVLERRCHHIRHQRPDVVMRTGCVELGIVEPRFDNHPSTEFGARVLLRADTRASPVPRYNFGTTQRREGPNGSIRAPAFLATITPEGMVIEASGFHWESVTHSDSRRDVHGRSLTLPLTQAELSCNRKRVRWWHCSESLGRRRFSQRHAG